MGPCHCPHSAPSGPLPASSPYKATRLPGCLSALRCPLCPRASAPAVPFAQKLCSQCPTGSPCRGHSVPWSPVTTSLNQLLPPRSPRHLLLMGRTVIHGQSRSAKWSSSWAPCRPCVVVITGRPVASPELPPWGCAGGLGTRVASEAASGESTALGLLPSLLPGPGCDFTCGHEVAPLCHRRGPPASAA